VLSCADAIATVLDAHIRGQAETAGNGQVEVKAVSADIGPVKNVAGQCPDCGGLLRYQEGCFICPACGYTKC
jgi:ribonucleoside-diphosphate reductase alpha chain